MILNLEGSLRLVCPQKRFFDFNEIWYVDTGRWLMHDGMPHDPIQGHGHECFKAIRGVRLSVPHGTNFYGWCHCDWCHDCLFYSSASGRHVWINGKTVNLAILIIWTPELHNIVLVLYLWKVWQFICDHLAIKISALQTSAMLAYSHADVLITSDDFVLW